MIDAQALAELGAAVRDFGQALATVAHGPLSETATKVSVRFTPAPENLEGLLALLAPHAGIWDTTLEGEVAGWPFSARVTPGGLAPDRGRRAPAPEDLGLSGPQAQRYEAFARRLGASPPPGLPDLAREIAQLPASGLAPRLAVAVFGDKEALLAALNLDPGVRPILYLAADKFLGELQGKPLAEVMTFLMPEARDALLILLGDTRGVARGPHLRVCGLDQWVADEAGFASTAAARQALTEARAFRREECQWPFGQPALAPPLLQVTETSLAAAAVTRTLGALANRLAVAHLAHLTEARGQGLRAQVRGHKLVEIDLAPLPAPPEAEGASILELFAWAYENHSSDKLGIVRQIISLVLGEEPQLNYGRLADKAGDMLASAQSNFQLYLRRNVELYFDKRLRVSQYLQQFTAQVDKNIGELTTELVGNAYKTVGVILGVVIAALLNPDYTAAVTAIAALLYFAYLLLILFYWLPALGLKFDEQRADYEQAVLELRDVLAEDEIRRLQGETFARKAATFGRYFAWTRTIYQLLAIAAALIAALAAVLAWSAARGLL